MAKKDLNKNLHKAKSNKKDEFYTQLSDILHLGTRVEKR